MLVGAGLPAILATVLGLPAWILYLTMVAAVRIGAAVPGASVELLEPWNVVAGAASVLAIAVAARWASRALRRSARCFEAGRPSRRHDTGRTRRLPGSRVEPAPRSGPVVVATFGLALVLVYRPNGVTRVVVLDVGQGDGILVEGGRGGRMLVDGGPDPGRLLIALDERLPPWDRRIDILVLTHPHEDHVAGLGGAAPALPAWAACTSRA
jgi:competence protein ComEC